MMKLNDCISLKLLLATMLTLALSGCSSLNPFVDATERAQKTAPGFKKVTLKTEDFDFYSLQKQSAPGENVRIYVEGDGRAWLSKHQLSDDPTPKDLLFLQLAAMDNHPNVVYLARSCQFLDRQSLKDCPSKYWSSHRYAPEVIQSTNQAINQIKTQFKAKQVELFGYSGGGGIVTLAASKRNDVSYIATVAGNIDLKGMDEQHKSTPLYGSLDPLTIASKINHIPQNHFSGKKDTVVPPKIAQRFKEESLKNAQNPNCVQVYEQKGVTHHSGWQKIWKDLLTTPKGC